MTCEALQPFKVPGYPHDPPLLPYLDDPKGFNYDVQLTVEIQGEKRWDDLGILSFDNLVLQDPTKMNTLK